MSAPRLLGPLTLRASASGEWWAMNQREKGWASFGYPFAFLGDALDAFNAKAVSFATDEHGLYLTAVDRGDVEFEAFAATCTSRVALPTPRRHANALNVEVGTPLARCTRKLPEHWAGSGASALRWLGSGGSPLVFGECSADCPARRS
jgi:hypothetical protein